MDWDDFKFVQAVARAGSVRAAGDDLGVHASTVTRHLEQLERRLGTRLFARTRQGMQITPAGAAVIDALDRVAAELDQVERSLQARGASISGPLRLSVPNSLASSLVVPGLAPFLREYAEVDLRVTTGPGLAELERGQADLALCLTDEPPGSLVGRVLGPLMVCAYVSDDLADAKRPVDSPSNPPDEGGLGAPLASRVVAADLAHAGAGLLLDDPAVAASAVRSGLGVAWLPCYLGDALPGVARLSGAVPVRATDLWLVSRPESRGVARVQALTEFLQRLFARLKPRLTGASAAGAEPLP